MKFAYAALMAAFTACLCLSTTAEAKCGDSGTCSHGRIYLKPVKTTTAKATARTTTSTRAIAAKPRKIKQVQRARVKKPVQTAHYTRKSRATSTRAARLHKVSTTRMALSFPIARKAPSIQDVSPKSTSHAAHSGSSAAVVTLIKTMAPQYGVPTWFALRIAKIESGFRCNARNGRAVGVFQNTRPEAFGVSRAAAMTCAGGVRAGVAHMRACAAKGARTAAQHMRCHNSGSPWGRVERAYRIAMRG